MRTLLLPVIFAAVILVSGCATSPRQTYVSQHPDLPSEHRRIMLAGKIRYADPVVGMTKEEIQLTMGKAPTRVEFPEGEEAWIWVREKTGAQADPWDPTNADSVQVGSEAVRRNSGSTKTSTMAAPDKRQIKTTVFFHGDRANRAEIDED